MQALTANLTEAHERVVNLERQLTQHEEDVQCLVPLRRRAQEVEAQARRLEAQQVRIVQLENDNLRLQQVLDQIRAAAAGH